MVLLQPSRLEAKVMLRAMFFSFVLGVVVSPHLEAFATDGGASLLQQVRAVLSMDAYAQISRALSHS
jgi:hypothetical protein